MKNLDPKYVARHKVNFESLGSQFQKPGSVILLSTAFGGFTIYGVASMWLIAYDVFLKLLP